VSSLNSNIVSEFIFQTSRSGGKGGQHVNTTESKVELAFHVASSAFLKEEQKYLIVHKLKNKIDTEGYLHLYESGDRSQHANKDTLIKKTFKLLAAALIKPKKRVATKPSKAAKRKRVESKIHKSKIKSTRNKKIDLG
jgi:ribosome-associated protein